MEFIERFESTNNQYTRKIKDSQFFSRTHTSVKGRWNDRYLFTNNFKYGFSVCFLKNILKSPVIKLNYHLNITVSYI